MTPVSRFKIQFCALALATLGGFGCLCVGAWRIPQTEADAQEWAGRLGDRILQAEAEAQRIHAYNQKAYLAEVLKAANSEGGADIDVRAANLMRLHQLYVARSEAANESLRETGEWSPVTWWTNPLTGQKKALNATADGRLDPAAIAAVKAGLDLDVTIALARERAAQEAPLSPRERVERDLAALIGPK